jgi:hypothetical protein
MHILGHTSLYNKQSTAYTVKKEKKVFFLCKEIQKGSGAKSYMRKSYLIYEEMRKYLVIYSMRRLLVVYDFAPDPF